MIKNIDKFAKLLGRIEAFGGKKAKAVIDNFDLALEKAYNHATLMPFLHHPTDEAITFIVDSLHDGLVNSGKKLVANSEFFQIDVPDHLVDKAVLEFRNFVEGLKTLPNIAKDKNMQFLLSERAKQVEASIFDKKKTASKVEFLGDFFLFWANYE